jgi:hypothetical protein
MNLKVNNKVKMNKLNKKINKKILSMKIMKLYNLNNYSLSK